MSSPRLTRSPAALTLGLALAVTGLVALPTQTATAANPTSPLRNGDFEAGLTGWKAGTAKTRLSTVRTQRSSRAARVTSSTRRAVLTDVDRRLDFSPGAQYRATAWVKATRPGVKATLVVKELTSGTNPKTAKSTSVRTDRWTRIRFPVTVRHADSRLDFRLRADGLGGGALLVDDAELRRTATRATGSSRASAKRLSNGCRVSARGIPACGALMGGAYRANHDPRPWEKQMGRKLGVHRLFYSSKQLRGALRDVKADTARGRLPWISFKTPHSWTQMANGKGDAWAKNIARQLRTVRGPVWLAFDHEPEDNGNVQEWKRMQARLAPIVRREAGNVAYTIILMGYHQFYGAKKFSMANMWPKTKIDLVGFDVYNHFGKNGRKKHTDMGAYFTKMQAWSKKTGVPWGLAESGISHAGAANRPGWFKDTYAKLRAKGGKAFSYFNTNLHSFTDWRLNTKVKRKRFAATLKTSPTL